MVSISPFRPTQRVVELEEQRLHEALMRRAAEQTRSSTNHLNTQDNNLPAGNPYGLELDNNHFQVLPRELPAHIDAASQPRWRIEITGLGVRRTAPIGIEVCGDVVFGMDRGDTTPDFDLAPYEGADHGVSRRHAMLRPTRNRLYLLDLQSTNGTRLNTLPVGPGVAMEVRTGDLVSFGNLSFTVSIISRP